MKEELSNNIKKNIRDEPIVIGGGDL